MTAGPGRVELVRIALGACGTAAPRVVAALEGGRRPDRLTVGAYRVLGQRQVVQGLVTAADGNARRAGAVVDVLHAASMVLIAVLDAGRRRAALVQAGTATGFAVAELAAVARSADR
jgi:hypothetical protein